MQQAAINDKYSNNLAAYYSRKLRAKVEGVEFLELPPSNDWLVNTKLSLLKVEHNLSKMGQNFQEAFDKSGFENKVKGWFKSWGKAAPQQT